MKTRFALQFKCSHCDKSLMNFFKFIDGEPCVKLIANSDFPLFLSSVWESSNAESEKEISLNETYDFNCPHCNTSLISETKCKDCYSKVLELDLNAGGKAQVCSRRGCSHRELVVGDIHDFIRISGQVSESKSVPFLKPKGELDKRVYLNSTCPDCNDQLIKDNMFVFKTDSGFLYMEPYLNIYKHNKDFEFAKNFSTNELSCTSCCSSLVKNQAECNESHSKCARINILAMNESIPMDFCIEKDCSWHSIDNENLNKLLLEDSGQW